MDTFQNDGKAPEAEQVVTENPNPSENQPSETRYASIEDNQARERIVKEPDYSKGAVVKKGDEVVTIFVEDRDGKDFVEQAQAFAAEHGYEVTE